MHEGASTTMSGLVMGVWKFLAHFLNEDIEGGNQLANNTSHKPTFIFVYPQMYISKNSFLKRNFDETRAYFS
jgi:hypothetical protein